MAAAVGHRGSRASVDVNLDPIIPVVVRIITGADLENVFKGALDCADSSAFLNVTLVSLKSIPFVQRGDDPIVQKFDNALSCRIRYLEAAVMGMASVVYNFVFGAFFSLLSVATVGQVKIFADQMRKHWIHTALAATAVGIAAAGTFSPALGQKANFAAVVAIGGLLTQIAQASVVGKISQAYQAHKVELRTATLQGVRGDRGLFDREFAPLLDYLDSHLTEQIQTLPDLAEVIQGAGARLPNIAPIATPERILGHLREAVGV